MNFGNNNQTNMNNFFLNQFSNQYNYQNNPFFNPLNNFNIMNQNMNQINNMNLMNQNTNNNHNLNDLDYLIDFMKLINLIIKFYERNGNCNMNYNNKNQIKSLIKQIHFNTNE